MGKKKKRKENMQGQMSMVSREIETLRKNQKEVLEINNISISEDVFDTHQ